MEKESVKKFDLEAAFKALDEIEIPQTKGIKANRVDLKERFGHKPATETLVEDYYDVSSTEDLKDAKEERDGEVAKAKLARIEKIVDLNAEKPEDLLPSYVGKVIMQCPQCMTLFYKNPEDIEQSEENPDVVNLNEPCQHCGNTSGYNLIGKVGAVTEDEADKYDETSAEENELDLDFGDGTEEVDAEGTGEGAEEMSDEETKEESSDEASSDEDLDLDLNLDEVPEEESEEEEKKEESLNLSKEASENESEHKSENLTLNEEIDKDLDEKLKAHNDYIAYLQQMIKQEEEALKKADNEYIKKAIQRRIDAFKADLEEALPEELKDEVETDLPTAEEIDLEATENVEEPKEETKESLTESTEFEEIINDLLNSPELAADSLHEGVVTDYVKKIWTGIEICDPLNTPLPELLKAMGRANKELDKNPKYLKNGKFRYFFLKNMPVELQAEFIRELLDKVIAEGFNSEATEKIFELWFKSKCSPEAWKLVKFNHLTESLALNESAESEIDSIIASWDVNESLNLQPSIADRFTKSQLAELTPEEIKILQEPLKNRAEVDKIIAKYNPKHKVNEGIKFKTTDKLCSVVLNGRQCFAGTKEECEKFIKDHKSEEAAREIGGFKLLNTAEIYVNESLTEEGDLDRLLDSDEFKTPVSEEEIDAARREVEKEGLEEKCGKQKITEESDSEIAAIINSWEDTPEVPVEESCEGPECESKEDCDDCLKEEKEDKAEAEETDSSEDSEEVCFTAEEVKEVATDVAQSLATPVEDEEEAEKQAEEISEVVDEKVDKAIEEKAEEADKDEESAEENESDEEESEEAEIEEPKFNEDDIDELDEDSLNKHIDEYLKEVYSNVKSYETTDCSLKEGKLIVEGKISFNSGKERLTMFEFLPAYCEGNLFFEGYNKDFSEDKAFTLNCSINEAKKLITESFGYKYKINKNLVKGLK